MTTLLSPQPPLPMLGAMFTVAVITQAYRVADIGIEMASKQPWRFSVRSVTSDGVEVTTHYSYSFGTNKLERSRVPVLQPTLLTEESVRGEIMLAAASGMQFDESTLWQEYLEGGVKTAQRTVPTTDDLIRVYFNNILDMPLRALVAPI